MIASKFDTLEHRRRRGRYRWGRSWPGRSRTVGRRRLSNPLEDDAALPFVSARHFAVFEDTGDLGVGYAPFTQKLDTAECARAGQAVIETCRPIRTGQPVDIHLIAGAADGIGELVHFHRLF